jgi:hypothetical protein
MRISQYHRRFNRKRGISNHMTETDHQNERSIGEDDDQWQYPRVPIELTIATRGVSRRYWPGISTRG